MEHMKESFELPRGLGVLSPFVITSCANEEKLPHPELAVLLINPCC